MRRSTHVRRVAMGEKELVLGNAEQLDLVRDGGREKALKKIENFLEQNKKDALDRHERLWAAYFCRLSCRFLGIDIQQLAKLDNEDMKYIDEITAKKARLWHRITQILFIVPVIGWIGFFVACNNEVACDYGEAVQSWHYIRERNKLKKALGDGFFPIDKVRGILREKYGL